MPFGIIPGLKIKMIEMTAEKIKDKKIENRTFEENTSLGKIQDRITELELRIENLENK